MNVVTPMSVSIAALLVQSVRADIPSVSADVPSRAQAFAEDISPQVSSRWFEANAPHRSFLSETRLGLETSILPEELREPVRMALDAARLGAIPAIKAADILWWALAVDFFRRIPGSSEPRLDPKTGFLEFRCTKSHLVEADGISLGQRLQMIEGFLGHRISLYEEADGEAVVRVPKLSFLEETVNASSAGSPVFGYGGVTRWSLATGEVPRDDHNAAHLRDEATLALPLTMIPLSHAGGEVHPFIFAAHDLYHAVRVATLPQPLRRMAGGLYVAVRGLEPSLQGLSFVNSLLDVLSDMDFQVGTSDELMESAFLTFRDDVRRERAEGSFDEEKAALFRRFLSEAHAAWEPYIHESRRIAVASFLRNLAP